MRAAAHNNNMESAIELLKEMGDNNFRLAEDTVLEVISCWSRLSANPSMMSQADFLLEALLVCLGRNQQHLNDAIASIMMSHFDKYCVS